MRLSPGPTSRGDVKCKIRSWLFGYTPGSPEANAIADSFLCLVNGTKKLVNVLTAAKDIGFDPPVTSACFRLCSLKSTAEA